MAEIAENEERVFENFLDLPEKARMAVIDEMKPDDRCRMTRVSKQCNKEAKASKNYIFELEFICYSESSLEIRVLHKKLVHLNVCFGYILVFTEMSGIKNKNYYGMHRVGTSWDVDLDESTDLVQCVIDEFKNLMKCYQKTIKKLSIHESDTNPGVLENIDFGIESLDSLEDLSVLSSYPVQQIFSKLHRPLKTLRVGGERNSAFIVNCEQTYQVQQFLHCWELELDNQQFSRLLAKQVDMSVKKLTERDVFKFIRSWQDGSIGMEIRTCCWNLRGSNFDMKKLSRLLRVGNNPNLNERIEIKHFENLGKRALLRVLNETLYFAA